MARVNKFAAQNLNDIYGKKEPKAPTPTDNANPAGNRPRGSGMLVLTRPVKQPQPQPLSSVVPKEGKTIQAGLGLSSSSSSSLKKESVPGVQAVQNPVSSTNSVVISIEKDSKPEAESSGSNPGKDKTATLTTPPAQNAKIESETISLRPQGVYTPPAARGMQAVHLAVGAGIKRPVSIENAAVSQEKTEAPPAPFDQPALSAEPLGPCPPGKELQEPIDEKGLENLTGEAITDALPPPPPQIKPSRPEPFRPPQLRGDTATRITKTESEAGPSYPPTPTWDDPSLGRRDTRSNLQQQPRGRREERSVQEGGRYFRDPPQGRYDHPEDRMHERPGSGGNGYYYYNRESNSQSRPGPEGGRSYDIEVIRPGSGGSDYVKDRYNSNNRDFAYGGRQNFDRQMTSVPDNLYREGYGNNYDSSYEHRQDFNRQDGTYRNNYNHQFRPGGMNREFVNRGGYGGGVRGGGGQRREQYGRNNHFGPGGHFRDNFVQPSINGRFSGQQKEQEGSFRQHSRMQRDTYGGGGGYRYNGLGHASNMGYGDEVYQRPRSGGYEVDSTRPGSGGYGGDVGGRPIGSADSMRNRPGFYNGRRSPISQDKTGHDDYTNGPQGRYRQFDGPGSRMNEMQGVDAGYQRPRSGGYRGIVSGRSMASSDSQMSSSNNFIDKIDHEGFSSRPQERYHFEAPFSTASEVQSSDFLSNRRLDNSRDSFNEFDSYRPRRDIYKAEAILDENPQEIACDFSMEYNVLNSESFKAGSHEEELVRGNHKVDTEQTFFGEDKRPYLTEEEQQIENARKKTVDQDQFSEGMTLQLRQEGSLQQDMREELIEVVPNGEPIIESAVSHIVFNGTSGQHKEEDNPANLYSLEKDKLADRFASSKILVGHSTSPRQVQTDSSSSMRSPNYYGSRGAGQQTSSYRSRSSSNSWRKETSETKNVPARGFTSMYGEHNYRSQSRESPTTERYQF